MGGEVRPMKTSAQFSLSVHAMLMIACFPNEKITSQIVAESAGCNPVIIRNAFIKLRRAGLLTTKSGKGKNTLTRPAEEITLWDVYSAIEGKQAGLPVRVHDTASGACPVGSSVCRILSAHIADAADAMRRSLESVSLADLREEIARCSAQTAR